MIEWYFERNFSQAHTSKVGTTYKIIANVKQLPSRDMGDLCLTESGPAVVTEVDESDQKPTIIITPKNLNSDKVKELTNSKEQRVNCIILPHS